MDKQDELARVIGDACWEKWGDGPWGGQRPSKSSAKPQPSAPLWRRKKLLIGLPLPSS